MEKNEKKLSFTDFLKKNAHFFMLGFGVIAILSLFLPLLKYVVGEETKFVNLISYLSFQNKFDWLIIPTLLFLLVGTVFGFLYHKHKNYIAFSSLGFLLGTLFIFLGKEFFKANELSVSGLKFGVGSYLAIAFGLFAIITSFSVNNESHPMTIRDIAEEGILVASAFVLDFIKIPIGSTGGSINLQMLPLLIIALRKGPMHALLSSGIVYGLLTCFSDGYGLFTFPFDYLIGFGSVAALGFFQRFIISEKQTTYNLKGILFLAIGCAPVFLIRMLGAMTSSMVLYGADFAFAFSYNIIYVGPSVLFSLIALIGLYGPLIKINSLFPMK